MQAARALADAAATVPALQTVAARLDKLQADVPSSADLANVTKQLATLESGMAALKGLAQMKADIEALLSKAAKLDKVGADLDLTKEDVLRLRTALESSQGQLASATELVSRITRRLDELDGVAAEVDSVSSQVRNLWPHLRSNLSFSCLLYGTGRLLANVDRAMTFQHMLPH